MTAQFEEPITRSCHDDLFFPMPDQISHQEDQQSFYVFIDIFLARRAVLGLDCLIVVRLD